MPSASLDFLIQRKDIGSLVTPTKEGGFVTHKENKTIKFKRSPEGPCQCKVSEDCNEDAQVKARKDGTSDLISTATESRNIPR